MPARDSNLESPDSNLVSYLNDSILRLGEFRNVVILQILNLKVNFPHQNCKLNFRENRSNRMKNCGEFLH